MVSSGCYSIFGTRETDGLTAQVVAVGFDHPMPWATMNAPLAWTLWLLLWLHSLVVGGSAGSTICKDVILTQVEGGLLSRISVFVNEVKGSIAHQSSSTLSANWQDSPGISGWAFSAQYPESLGVGQDLLGLFQAVVLSTKPCIRKGQKLVQFQRVRGWQC